MALSFSEAAAQAVQGAACSLLALSDEATRWINSAIGADGDFGNIAGALRKNVCNESDPDTSDFGTSAGFTGGQCLCSRYTITITFEYVRTGGVEVTTFVRKVRGPITQIDARYSGSRFNPFVADITANAIGSSSSTPSCNPAGTTESETIGPTGPTFQEDQLDSITIDIDVTVNTNDPDDCGDPPAPEPGDYNDYSETVSITYEDNSETSITEDVDITLGPLIVGIGGILYAPVTVGTGDITLNGTLKLAPEISVDLFPDGLFGGGGNTDDPAPTPGEPDPEPQTPDDRRRIIGAIVTVTNFDETIAKVTQVAQGDSPDIFVPRTGNVSFYIDTPGGQAWTEPKPLRNIREYVPCPAREGAVDVAVTAGTGFTLDVTPVYADLAVT